MYSLCNSRNTDKSNDISFVKISSAVKGYSNSQRNWHTHMQPKNITLPRSSVKSVSAIKFIWHQELIWSESARPVTNSPNTKRPLYKMATETQELTPYPSTLIFCLIISTNRIKKVWLRFVMSGDAFLAQFKLFIVVFRGDESIVFYEINSEGYRQLAVVFI